MASVTASVREIASIRSSPRSWKSVVVTEALDGRPDVGLGDGPA